MTDWTYARLHSLQVWRESGATMAQLCHQFHMHTRDEIVEAVDALVRSDSITAALEHVDFVLAAQSAKVPLINGREHWTVTADRGRKSYGVGG